jgi:hypothetical protein
MASPPDHSSPRQAWLNRMGWAVPLVCGALVGIAMRLLFHGKPGEPYQPMMRSFVLLVPVLVGALAVYLAERVRRRSWSYYFWVGAGANALLVCGAFLIMIEGLICVILAVPLFGLIGGIAGLGMGAVCRWTDWPKHAVYGFAALPLLLGGFEQNIPLPLEVHSVERTYMVSAPPEKIWPQLVAAENIRPSEIGGAWMYRIGVPLPLSAVTELVNGKEVRHIKMGKGIQFNQVAADWEPNRRVRWLYLFAQDSFPAGALDDHVRIGGAYFDVLDTEYTLREVSGGTELRARMSYRVSTSFNWYARPIAEFLIGNFEEAALSFYAHRAMAQSPSL